MDKQKILYVDDEFANLILFEATFEELYTVLIAENITVAYDIMAENKDLKFVISDMRMPEMDGIEFIKQARKSYPDINYYILTSFENTDDIQRAQDSGIIKHYFRKPFRVIEISSEINKVFCREKETTM